MEQINTNKIGNITELQCILAFESYGWTVSLPFGGQARYDFLAEKNGKILRIQVKTSRMDKEDNAYLEFSCRSSHYIGGKHIHTKYSKNDIDYFATFQQGKVYLVPVEECSDKKLRFKPTKNGQIKGINWAVSYELEEVLKNFI